MSEKSDFEVFEIQLLKIVGELRVQNDSVSRLRQALAAEASRAEAAEAQRDAAAREAEEARAETAETAAGTAQLAAQLSAANADLVTTSARLETAEREKALLEQHVFEMTSQQHAQQRELAAMREREAALSAQRAEFSQLQQRTKQAAAEANASAQRLESELRRVERAAAAGEELRERARLAASAHARERRLADAELRHTAADLLQANVEINRLTVALKEARQQLADLNSENRKDGVFSTAEWEKRVSELRSALDMERSGTSRLERALAALAADYKTLAAATEEERKATAMEDEDNMQQSPHGARFGEIGDMHPLPAIEAIDSFLKV